MERFGFDERVKGGECLLVDYGSEERLGDRLLGEVASRKARLNPSRWAPVVGCRFYCEQTDLGRSTK
jgi:hypothetical protein